MIRTRCRIESQKRLVSDAVAIKPLKWRRGHFNMWIAVGVGFTYSYRQASEISWTWFSNRKLIGTCDSEEAARAAAQKLHELRIWGAIRQIAEEKAG